MSLRLTVTMSTPRTSNSPYHVITCHGLPAVELAKAQS